MTRIPTFLSTACSLISLHFETLFFATRNLETRVTHVTHVTKILANNANIVQTLYPKIPGVTFGYIGVNIQSSIPELLKALGIEAAKELFVADLITGVVPERNNQELSAVIYAFKWPKTRGLTYQGPHFSNQ